MTVDKSQILALRRHISQTTARDERDKPVTTPAEDVYSSLVRIKK